MDRSEIDAFWNDARIRAGLNPISGIGGVGVDESLPPPAWSFGGTPEQADESLELMLAGVKTATAGALRDYELEDAKVPEPGDLSIILDSGGHPRALIRTTHVESVRFDKVTEEHAYAEGEGDRTLAHWRAVHEWFFKEYDEHLRGFSQNMIVVCERFELLVPTGPELEQYRAARRRPA